MEVEYMVFVEADKEIIWVKGFIRDLGIRQEEFRLYYDNHSAIHLAKKCRLPLDDQTQSKEIPLAPRVDRRKGVCSDEDPYSGERIRHVNKGIVGREDGCMPKMGWIDKAPHTEV